MAIGIGSSWDDPETEVVIQKVDLTDTELAFEIATKKIKTLSVFELHKLNEKYGSVFSLNEKYYGLEKLTMLQLDRLETDLGIAFMFLLTKQPEEDFKVDPNLVIKQCPDVIKENKPEPENISYKPLGSKSRVFEGDVILSGQGLTEIPEKYKDSIINGNFNISRNEIKDLRNSPKQINGDFVAHHNLLISLEHGPQNVTGRYLLYGNKIFLLYGIDEESRIYDNFSCSPMSGFQGGSYICGCQSSTYVPCEHNGGISPQEKLKSDRDQWKDFLGSSVYNEGNRLLSLRGLPNQYNEKEKVKLFEEAVIQFNKLSTQDQNHIIELMKDWDSEAYQKLLKVVDDYHSPEENIDVIAEKFQKLFKNKKLYAGGWKIDNKRTWTYQSKGPQMGYESAYPKPEDYPFEYKLVSRINNLIKNIEYKEAETFLVSRGHLNTGKLVTLVDVLNLRVGDMKGLVEDLDCYEECGRLTMRGNWG